MIIIFKLSASGSKTEHTLQLFIRFETLQGQWLKCSFRYAALQVPYRTHTFEGHALVFVEFHKLVRDARTLIR